MSKKNRQIVTAKIEPVREIAPVVTEVSQPEELTALGEPDISNVEPAPPACLTFEDFLSAYRRGQSFEVCAVAPYAGGHIGAGVSVGKEPRTFPIAQLFQLDRSYTELLLSDARISVRIVE